jgi:nitroreductase
MELSALLKKRKSVRKYKSQPVEAEKLQQLLEAGRLAPTASNGQNWYCIVLRNPQLRSQMGEACGNQAWVGQAPVNLVICGANNRNMFCGQPINPIDCSIALTLMMLKATELGLGTCWLGRFDAGKVRELLAIPAEDTIVAVTPLGYADEEPEARPRKDLAEFVRYVD